MHISGLYMYYIHLHSIGQSKSHVHKTQSKAMFKVIGTEKYTLPQGEGGEEQLFDE